MHLEDLQHIANNLPDSFTNLKGVTKSLNLARNAPERVEVPIKTTQLPIPKKRGSSTASDPEHASSKQQMKSRRKTSESVNAGQLNIDKHLMGSINHSGRETSTTQFQCAQTDWDIGTPRLDRIGKSRRVTRGAGNFHQLC